MESIELEFKNAVQRNLMTGNAHIPNGKMDRNLVESNIRSEVFQQAQELRVSLESKLELSMDSRIQPLEQDLLIVQTKVNQLYVNGVQDGKSKFRHACLQRVLKLCGYSGWMTYCLAH